MKDINKFRRKLGDMIGQGRIPGYKLDRIIEDLETNTDDFLDKLFKDAVLINDPATTSALLTLGFLYNSENENIWFEKITNENLENDPFINRSRHSHNYQDYLVSLILTLIESAKFTEPEYQIFFVPFVKHLHSKPENSHHFTTIQIQDFKRIFSSNLEHLGKYRQIEFKKTIKTLCGLITNQLDADIKYLDPETNPKYFHIAGWMVKQIGHTYYNLL